MSRNRKQNRTPRSLRLESLENRQMMSGTPWEMPLETTIASPAAQRAAFIGPHPSTPVVVQDDGPHDGAYGRPLHISVATLLQNDSGANFRIVEGSFNSAAGGTVQIINGLVTYYHPADAMHEDSFKYEVKYDVPDGNVIVGPGGGLGGLRKSR